MSFGIGNVKGKSGGVYMYETVVAPTDLGGGVAYSLSTSDVVETAKNGDFIAYIDNGSISSLYKVTAVLESTYSLAKIGDIGGGGKQLYRHCIVANADFSTYGYTYHLTFDIINDNANALNTNVKIAEYLYNHDIKWDSGLTKMLPISGWILLTGQPAGNPNGVCIPQGLQGSYSGPGGYVLSVVNIIDTDGNSSTSAGSTINNATFTDTVIAL